jgi:hypothetical protein
MTALAEALGLTLPGASSIPAADSNHVRMAMNCGTRIVEMVWEARKPSDILTRESFENAIGGIVSKHIPTPFNDFDDRLLSHALTELFYWPAASGRISRPRVGMQERSPPRSKRVPSDSPMEGGILLLEKPARQGTP